MAWDSARLLGEDPYGLGQDEHGYLVVQCASVAPAARLGLARIGVFGRAGPVGDSDRSQKSQA